MDHRDLGSRPSVRPISNRLSDQLARSDIYTTFPLSHTIGIPPHDHASRLTELGFPHDPTSYAVRLLDDEQGRARWTWWQPMYMNSFSRFPQATHGALRYWDVTRHLYIAREGRQLAQQSEERRAAAECEEAQRRETDLSDGINDTRDATNRVAEHTHASTSAHANFTSNSTSTRASTRVTVAPAADSYFGTRTTPSAAPHGGKSYTATPIRSSKAYPVNPAPQATSSIDVANLTTRCEPCLRRKKGCDGQRPCGQCVRKGLKAQQCVPRYREKDKALLQQAGLPTNPDQAGQPPPAKRLETDSTSTSTKAPSFAQVQSVSTGVVARSSANRAFSQGVSTLTGSSISQAHQASHSINTRSTHTGASNSAFGNGASTLRRTFEQLDGTRPNPESESSPESG